MLSPIVTQGFGYRNDTIAFVVSQGFGVFDSAGIVIVEPEPVVVVDTGEIAEYINQGIVQVRNGRVVVAYQRGGYAALSKPYQSNEKDILNDRLAPQFGVAFDRYYETDLGGE